MAYTTIDKPSDYFNTKLYTGNGSSGHAITGLDFKPDWIWIKDRGAANWHSVRDSVRGTSRQLFTNEARGEETASYVTSFNSNGFTLGTGNSDVNANNNTYASWNWKGGTSFTNDASGTGIGTIDSAGSFNNDAGFSIVSYTGTGSNGTVKHGLNSVPKMIIIKKRNGTDNWIVYHKSLSAVDRYVMLNTTDGESANSAAFNDTRPTSSVFSLGSFTKSNASNSTFIAYCFADKQGYSKFGKYTGNGNANGTFIYTGFKPAFIITKYTGGDGQNWQMYDNKRNPHNFVDTVLFPNGSADEEAYDKYDFLSNGFKARAANTGTNGSGSPYIYMAFAENPFTTSTGIPATAR